MQSGADGPQVPSSGGAGAAVGADVSACVDGCRPQRVRQVYTRSRLRLGLGGPCGLHGRGPSFRVESGKGLAGVAPRDQSQSHPSEGARRSWAKRGRSRLPGSPQPLPPEPPAECDGDSQARAPWGRAELLHGMHGAQCPALGWGDPRTGSLTIAIMSLVSFTKHLLCARHFSFTTSVLSNPGRSGLFPHVTSL